MALAVGHTANFETLSGAFEAGDVALMECELRATGEEAAVICAANRLANGEIEFVPFAMFFNGNPYELLNPPNPVGGFQGQTFGAPDDVDRHRKCDAVSRS